MKYCSPVYVLDDDKASAEETSQSLMQFGLNCQIINTEIVEEFIISGRSINGVILIENKLNGTSGLSLQKRLSHMKLQKRIIFSGDADVEDVIDAFKNGIFDFILRPYRIQNVVDSVSSALHELAAEKLAFETKMKNMKLFSSLSSTEQEIAKYIASGLKSKEVAFISKKAEGTVKVHKSRIFRKLQVNNIIELADIVKDFSHFDSLDC